MNKVLCLSLILVLSSFAFGACPGQNLLENPSDPSARGPWPVGSKTVVITSRNLTVEIFYPAFVGSDRGREYDSYSLRDDGFIPNLQAAKIPDEENPIQVIESFKNLPLDTLHGPYPVHVHIHGTAAFRTASAHQLTHFASRGFVVVSADHPGICLYDMLSLRFNGVDQEGDARKMIDELKAMTDSQLQFLKGHIDTNSIAVSGHSAGGSSVQGMGDVARVVQPWAAFGSEDLNLLESTLVLAGVDDGIVSYSNSKRGYNSSPTPKRLVGVGKAGHMFCTDLCWIGKEHGGIVEIAKRNKIYLAYLFGPLGEDGCDEDQIKDEDAWKIVNYAAAAAQEEILMCRTDMADAFKNMPNVFSYLEEFQEDL